MGRHQSQQFLYCWTHTWQSGIGAWHYLTMDTSTRVLQLHDSDFQASCHIAPSLRLTGPRNLQTHHHFLCFIYDSPHEWYHNVILAPTLLFLLWMLSSLHSHITFIQLLPLYGSTVQSSWPSRGHASINMHMTPVILSHPNRHTLLGSNLASSPYTLQFSGCPWNLAPPGYPQLSGGLPAVREGSGHTLGHHNGTSSLLCHSTCPKSMDASLS
jgi:hypothetical protein